MARLESTISEKDFEKVKLLRLFVDISNIRALLMEEPVDPRGNLTEKQLDEAIVVQYLLPQYVFDFLSQFEKVSDKIRYFSGLVALFFNQEIPKATGFLKDYLTFERESRLVLLALRAKRLGRDLVRELQFEDPTDPFVAQILSQRDAPQYEPPAQYAELKEIFLSCSGDPWQENRAFILYQFNHIEEISEKEQFTIDRILAYVAQLMLLESLSELDEEKGKMILDTFKEG